MGVRHQAELGGGSDRENYVDNFAMTVNRAVAKVSSKICVSNLNAFPFHLSLSLASFAPSASPPLRNSINLYTRQHWNI